MDHDQLQANREVLDPDRAIVMLEACPGCTGEPAELPHIWQCKKCGYWQIYRPCGVVIASYTVFAMPDPSSPEGYRIVNQDPDE